MYKHLFVALMLESKIVERRAEEEESEEEQSEEEQSEEEQSEEEQSEDYYEDFALKVASGIEVTRISSLVSK